MGQVEVEILSVGAVDESLILPLAEALARELGVPVAYSRDFVEEAAWRAPRGNALQPDAVLDSLTELAERRTEGSARRLFLAVARNPLFVAGRSVTFGEATLGGCCAVVSVAPLEAPGGSLSLDRLVKSAIHELGHVCGLPHCTDPACVMFPSEGIADTDRKRTAFCSSCRPRAARSFRTQ